MNKKRVLLVLISSSLLLGMFSSLFIAFVGAVPEGIGVEEKCLTKQDFANVASSCNRQYSFLRGESERICVTEASASPAEVELYYDDGTPELGWKWPIVGGMFAVRFTPPASGWLIECSFYIWNNPDTIMVHVLDTDKNDMITPFPETPTSTGWFHVDLSTYGITVSPGVDFYVAMESTVADVPSIGADTSHPDNRSWNYGGVSWSQVLEDDYMIRAVIETSFVDLKITDVYLEPSGPIMPGDNVNFSARVENQGTENATDFWVYLYLDGELFAEGKKSLAAGDYRIYYQPWEATLGNHTVGWVVDATDVIAESNEDNNNMSKTFRVGEYLTVGSPYGMPGGEDWYDRYTTAYATLDAGIVDHENGTRRVFTHWSGDASGTNYAQSDPIHMDGPKTAIANWKTQYLVTFDQTGLDDTANNTVVTVNGDTKTFFNLPNTTWVDDGGSISYSYSGTVSSSTSGKRFSLVDVTGPDSPISVTGPATVTGNYKTQYYLTISTNFGTATPSSGWHDAGSTVEINATASSATSGEQYVWLGWTGTGSGSYSGMDNPASITINEPINETATWRHEYYLTVTSPYGSPTPESGWFEVGESIIASVTSPVSGPAGIRYVCTGWTGTGSVPESGSATSVPFTINEPSSIMWAWKTQYYLTVSSTHGTTGGEDWYDEGDTAYATVTPLTVPGSTGVQYVFTHWSEDASGDSSPSGPIIMDRPKTAVANWKTQYLLTISTDPTGLSPQPNVSPSGPWYDNGTQVTLTAQEVSEHKFDHWTVDGESRGTDINPITVTMDSPHTALAIYQFPIHKPISWQDYITRPEILGLLIGVFSVIVTVTAFVATRRKRGRVRGLLDEIDDAYFRYKKNARRCEAELYRLKDIVLEDYKAGNIPEGSYNVLNKRIDDYIKEVLEQTK